MKKPTVKMINAVLIKNPLDGYQLAGKVIDHPRFEKGKQVVTSKIIKIETRNTIYIFED